MIRKIQREGMTLSRWIDGFLNLRSIRIPNSVFFDSIKKLGAAHPSGIAHPTFNLESKKAYQPEIENQHNR